MLGLFSFDLRFFNGEAVMFREPPECEDHAKCRFVSMGGVQSMVNYLPTYDRSGKQLPLECGSFTVRWNCGACGKSWSEIQVRPENKGHPSRSSGRPALMRAP
jgi:hypothetical protein